MLRYIFTSFILLQLFSCVLHRTPTEDLNRTLDNKINSKDLFKHRSVTKHFDLLHTRLELSVDWRTRMLNGEAYLLLKPYAKIQETLTLDAQYMDINKVCLVLGNEKNQLSFKYDSTKLNIDLGRSYIPQEEFLIYIEYVACPDRVKGEDKGLYFINKPSVDSLPVQLWTQGETEGASAWFPCIDAPNERCSQELLITVDNKWTTLSNGKLIYSSKNPDGTRTDYWKQDLPHAPYLFMLTIGQFYIHKEEWLNRPLWYYVDSAYAPYAKDIFGKTGKMLDFYSQILDYYYPWDKYSQVIVKDFISGAMENTSASVFYNGLHMTDRELKDFNHEDIIAHELFHHWFGDLVTCESWSHIALNEAFATYGEYLWFEHEYGKDRAAELMTHYKESYFRASEEVQHSLVRNYYDKSSDVFDTHSYEKGSAILHMLRAHLGYDIFIKGLRYYLKKHSYSDVETDELRLAMEDVSGQDLSWFFDQWFFGSGHPIINWDYKVKNGEVEINITQKHSSLGKLPFILPIDIDLCNDSIKIRHKLLVDQWQQSFKINAGFAPEAILFDPEHVLLADISAPYTKEDHLVLWQHTTHYEGYKNLYEILRLDKGPNVKNLMQQALLHPYQGIREFGSQYFLTNYDLISIADEKILKELFKDESSWVRKNSALALHKHGKLSPVMIQALVEDSSVSVSNWALELFYEIDKNKALEISRQRFLSLSYKDVLTSSKLIADSGMENDFELFVKAINTHSGYKLKRLLDSFEIYIKNLRSIKLLDKIEIVLEELEIKYKEEAYMRYIIVALNDQLALKKKSFKK